MADLARGWLGRFTAALEAGLAGAVEDLFAEECYWRDVVAFTWNFKTAEGRKAIGEMASSVRAGQSSKNWALKGEPEVLEDGEVEAWLTFETEACNCTGHVRLKADGKCWTFTTIAEELKGHPELTGPRRIEGRGYGPRRGREYYGTRQVREKQTLGMLDDCQPFVVIVGGGQSGLAIGARLKSLGVPNIILDRYPRAGDCWRVRYDALHLHDPVFACHLPLMPLPDSWPLWPSKDQLADFLEAYVQALDLNLWTKATCTAASWDESRKEWLVKVDRDGDEVTLKPKHLVLATGLYGGPFVPQLEGRESFEGRIFHSSEYKNGKEFAGKRAVVVGSNTSAHDVMEDLWEHGAEVTLVQRSPTMVIHIESQLTTVFPLYDDEAKAKGITTDKADLKMLTYPFKVVTESQIERTKKVRNMDAEYYRKLEEAGFGLDFGEDASGNVMMFLRRGSGYYFDTGASQLVIDREVKVRQGDVRGLSASGVVLQDGSKLDADVVVLATGYRPLNDTVEKFLGKEMADKLGTVWGLGSGTRGDSGPWEGELRNISKPTAQEGLWVQGGNLSFNRIYSKYLALQLQARYLGMPTPVHGAPEPPPFDPPRRPLGGS